MRAEPVTRTKVQRLVTVTFAAAGAVLVVAMLVGVPDSIVRWLKFVPIAALPVVALASRPVGASKYLAIVAMALSAVGDAFFLGFLPAAGGCNRIAGIATFSVAYLFLIAAFWRGRPARRELRFAVPLAMLGFGIVAALWQFANPLMRAMVPVFTVIIVTMAWTTLATRNRGHFASNASKADRAGRPHAGRERHRGRSARLPPRVHAHPDALRTVRSGDLSNRLAARPALRPQSEDCAGPRH